MAPPAGQHGCSGGSTLYARDAASFDHLSDAFQRARVQATNAASLLEVHASAVGDPFGHAAADSAYARTLSETLTALDNLGAGLLTLAQRVEQAGAGLVAADRGVASSMAP